MGGAGIAGRGVAFSGDRVEDGAVACTLFSVLFLSGLLAEDVAEGCRWGTRRVDSSWIVVCVLFISAFTPSGHASVYARLPVQVSSLVTGLLSFYVAPHDIGAYHVWHTGSVCISETLAASPSCCRCTAGAITEGVFAAVLRGVCAAHVFYATYLFLFGLPSMVLHHCGRCMAAPLDSAASHYAAECGRHMAVAEDPCRTLFDRVRGS